MILQALAELAEREELLQDADFEPKPVAYLVRVGEGGRLLGLESTHSPPPMEEGAKFKPRLRPKSLPVPREPSRTSGDRALLLVDKAEYALGLDPETDPDKRRDPDKLALRFSLFRERVAETLKATEDPGVAAVHAFLEEVAAGRQTVTLPEECKGNDLFAFVYAPDEDHPVHDREKVREYWSALRQAEEGAKEPRPCLVTGQLAPPAERHSVLKYVPGAVSSGVPLVSFNSRAFESYGWGGNDNALVSQRAAEAYATALQRLLHPAYPSPSEPGATLPRQNLRLGAETVVCFWTREDNAFAAMLDPLFAVRVEEVGELYRSLWSGRAPTINDPTAFYALTLSGSQGRVVVRGWFESTVEEVAGNLARYFQDIAIVRNTPKPKGQDHPPQLPLSVLVESLAPRGKSDQVPPSLASQVADAALRGLPFPLSALQRALLRARAEIGRDGWADLQRRDARAALIKAVLNRRHKNDPHFKEVTPAMDPTNDNRGYLLGRLMAVIERLQQLALNDVNASVVDRYFGAASATPRLVFSRLLKNSVHHEKKARDNSKSKGYAIKLGRQKDEILSRISPEGNGIPTHLNLEEQGLFLLGYHHQRHLLWQSKADREAQMEDADAVSTEN
jgi:CRISPR-associated protein Csd1